MNEVRRIPTKLSQREAGALVAAAVGAGDLALAFRTSTENALTAPELMALSTVLSMKPDISSPGVDFRLPLVHADALPHYEPPRAPSDTIRFARPADQRGALYDRDGEPIDEAVGSIAACLAELIPLVMRGHYFMERVGARRRRPTYLDIRGIMRRLMGLVTRCTTAELEARPATVVAELLFVHGHCEAQPKLKPPHAGKPGDRCVECSHEWIDHPTHGTCGIVGQRGRCNCAAKSPELPDWALRKLRAEHRDRLRELALRGDPFAIPGLPTIALVEPYVAKASSIRALANAIRDLARARDGQYQIDRAKRSGTRR
jgi:hypothetical protein